MPGAIRQTILYVANKRLPPNDYRVLFGRGHCCYRIIYALPEITPGLASEDYVRIGFREGVEISDVGNFLRLASYLCRHSKHVDLTHFYSTKLILLGPLVSRLFGIPSIMTITGFGRTFSHRGRGYALLQRIYLATLRVSMRACRRVLFQNFGDMEMLAQRLPAMAGKLVYAGSAVDMPVTTRASMRRPVLRVLLVARLMPEKGVEDFLQVARTLSGRNFEFVLVGPGSTGYPELEERVRQQHEVGVIQYRGELDANATRREFEGADVFYFPSYGEGLARVMLECGFAGLCPVACDIASNRDLVGPGRGFLLGPGQPQAATVVLERLASDRALLERNAAAYQAHVLQHYSADKFVGRMNALLREVVPPPRTVACVK